MDEVGGAVERIDYPSMFAFVSRCSAFFGKDGVGREGALDDFNDRVLGIAIDRGYEIDRAALAADFGAVQSFEMNATGGMCRTHRNLLKLAADHDENDSRGLNLPPV